MTRRNRLATVLVVLLTGAAVAPAAPARAARPPGQESHAYGVAAPTRGDAGRHAWGGWIGSWRTADGQLVYHLDPQARRGRASYRPATAGTTLAYHRRGVPGAEQQQAAWILSRFGGVAQRGQDAAVELALDALLVGGRFGLDGSTTRARLLRLDVPTRSDLVRLARQMIRDAQLQAGPYVIHLAKAGTSDATATPVSVSVTTAGGAPLARAQVALSVAGSTVTGALGPDGEPVTLAVPRAASAQQIAASASVPVTTLMLRAPTQRGLSRAAVAGVRGTVGAVATLSPATTWTLTSQQYVQTVPLSDTRTWQTLYSGTFQDSWTCSPGSKTSPCQDPAGDWCSHDVQLNSGTWVDYTSVPADGYRAGNTCVWRNYTETSSRVVQTGGTYTPAQFGWVPVTSSYTDAVQAQSALAACQRPGSLQRSCALSDDAALG